MLARLALLGAARRASPASGLPALSAAALRACGDATTSGAAASSSAACTRRGAASTSDSSSSSSGHIPHLARPTNDRRETTKWSLLHEQGHDVNPCNSK